nr:PEP/pyruvate-binding domain-containing protein [Fusibacter sp. A1]
MGGKAKYLHETSLEGFDVPAGIVLSVEYFKHWNDLIDAAPLWDVLSTRPTKALCEKLKTMAYGFEFNDEQIGTLDSALMEMPENAIFSVRSSSPEEDSDDISYAGMYETVLGVKRVDLTKSIKKVFASMLDYRVVEYKRLNGISIKRPRIAIIIQVQIDSEISGIAFSINPQNNSYDEIVINASFGLGETIVSGRVTPDIYIIDKGKNSIAEKAVNDKSRMLRLDKDGGTREVESTKKNVQALTDEQIFMVAELAVNCEKFYGKPMDIEWAISGEKLYLLQARPITGYFKLFNEMLTEPGEKKYLYLDLIVLTQGFSTSLSVLGLDIWKQLMERSMSFTDGEGGILVNLHGRQYLNVSNMVKALGIKSTMGTMGNYDLPTRRIVESIDFKDEYLPEIRTKKMKKMLTDSLKTMLRAFPMILYGLITQEGVLKKYKEKSDEIFEYCKLHLNEEKTFDALVDEGMSAYGEMVKYAYAIMISVIFLPKKIDKLFRGMEVDDSTILLNMDLPGNPTGEMGKSMIKLASYDGIQRTKTKDEFLKLFNANNYSKGFYDDFENYVRKFGCRCYKEIDIAASRYYERPEVLFEQLKQIDIGDNAVVSVKDRRLEAYQKLLLIAQENGFEKKFIKYEKKYHEVMGYRELPKYIYVVITDMFRKRALVLEERFKKEGRLKENERIFDLTISQLSKAERDRELDLQALIEKNMETRKEVNDLEAWPSVVDSRGKIFRYVRKSEEGELIGDPISPGVVRGVANVLLDPYEKSIHKGEILVTRSTEPSWTPVFINASAIVLEIGGPLQHGAIIAREYGIPCVSGINDAVETIKNGDLIEVDGTRGSVKIIGKQEKA